MKFTDPTTADHLLTSKMMKNDGKLKLSSNIKNEAEDIDTMSYGKAIRLPKHRGNQPRVLKTAQRISFKNTNTVTTYKQLINNPSACLINKYRRHHFL